MGSDLGYAVVLEVFKVDKEPCFCREPGGFSRQLESCENMRETPGPFPPGAGSRAC